MRVQINLDTMTDANNFVAITSRLPGKIVVIDNKGMCVNAKSILGMLYALEFEELWCESEFDIFEDIEKYVVC